MSAMDTSGPSGSSIALKRWNLENQVEVVDNIYKYDADEQQMIRSAKPWEKDPHYFKVFC
jgi:COP9 signalosome complex subunit 5